MWIITFLLFPGNYFGLLCAIGPMIEQPAILPRLAPVPSFIHPLTIKATQSGIVILKTATFRTRYTGSKQCSVSINGKLYLKAGELRKETKNPGKTTRVRVWSNDNEPQKYNEFSTTINNNPEPVNNLSTTRKQPAGYKINKREVRARIFGYLNTQAGAKELYFWTVTFPQGTSDEAAYKIYNIWLTALRQKKMLKNYIWIAERQENGTVHFHLAIPHKMPVQRANAMMAGTLKTFARRGLIPINEYQARRYNGVDIAKNRNTRRVTNFANKKGSRALSVYLTKYVTKNNTEFSFLAWHNSRGFSCLFTGVTFTELEYLNNGFHHWINTSKALTDDHFIYYPWKDGPPPPLLHHLYQINSYIQQNLN